MLIKQRSRGGLLLFDYTFTIVIQVIPSLSSILAMLLKLKFSVPESNLLTYCGLTPRRTASSHVSIHGSACNPSV